jgi:L-threonylcarbamoyladenylate synthase
MAKILNALSDSALIDILQSGGVGVIPTDTVYGVVCRAADETAVARLYALKNREQKPGTVIAASIEQLVDLGIKARYLKAVEQFWPNPISIIIPNHELAYIHLGVGSIAVRIPSNNTLEKLLKQTGPLLTSSANQPSKPEAATIKQAQEYFGETLDFYVDGGDLSDRKPSTLIRIVDDAIEVLRPGAVTIDEETGKIL